MSDGPGRLRQRLAGERLLRAAVEHRYLVIGAVLLAVTVPQFGRTDGDWPFLRHAAELLVGADRPYLLAPGGLHLYANYPEMQFGPVAIVAALPFAFLGDAGWWLASALMSASVLGLIHVVEAHGGPALRDASEPAAPAGDPDAPGRATVVVAGSLVAAAWVSLAAAYLHLDDVLALGATVLAVCAQRSGRRVAAGALLGVAVASKPWAVLFAPLLTAELWPRPWRADAAVWRRTAGPVVALAVVVAVAWGPFFLADAGTATALRPQTDVDAASVLRLFGVASGLAPAWVRAVQVVLGLVVVVVALARGRWEAVPLVAVAVRLATDPGAFPYYASGLILVALVWDLLRARCWVPVATLLVFGGIVLPGLGESLPSLRAVLRLVSCAAVVAYALTGPASSAVTAGPWRHPRAAG